MVTINWLFKQVARITAERDCWIENAKELQKHANQLQTEVKKLRKDNRGMRAKLGKLDDWGNY